MERSRRQRSCRHEDTGITMYELQNPDAPIQDVELRLNHLTYEAREVINRSQRRDDLNLYWQVMLIQICYNYGVEKVFRALGMQKPGKKGRDVTWVNEFSLREMMIDMVKLDDLGRSRWVLKDPIHDVNFNKEKLKGKAIRNLYRLDRLVLVSDFGIRLERLVEMLEDISDESLEGVAADVGRTTMPILLAEMERFFDMVKQSVQELKNSHMVVIEPTKPVDPVLLKVAETGLAELRDMEKKDRT